MMNIMSIFLPLRASPGRDRQLVAPWIYVRDEQRCDATRCCHAVCPNQAGLKESQFHNFTLIDEIGADGLRGCVIELAFVGIDGVIVSSKNAAATRLNFGRI